MEIPKEKVIVLHVIAFLTLGIQFLDWFLKNFGTKNECENENENENI